MEKIHFTIAGCSYYFGYEFMKEKTRVMLVKDCDNEYDKEAIRVELDGLGIVGFVANSPYSVMGESISGLVFMIGLGILLMVRYCMCWIRGLCAC